MALVGHLDDFKKIRTQAIRKDIRCTSSIHDLTETHRQNHVRGTRVLAITTLSDRAHDGY